MFFVFFFNDTATTEIYTLSLHDALPIWTGRDLHGGAAARTTAGPAALKRQEAEIRSSACRRRSGIAVDRKSTRLNSSHANISYAVFCLKKKKTRTRHAPSIHY